jgi:hypothetical protein
MVGFTPVANFGTEEFTGCDVSSNTAEKGIGDWPHIYYAVTRDGVCTSTECVRLISVGPITAPANYPAIWEGAS